MGAGCDEVIEMPVLVVYASKHGATREIAERVAQTMVAAGQQAQARPVTVAGDLAGYDAFVVGSGHDGASPTPKTRAIRQPSRRPTSLPGLRRGSNPEAGSDLSDHRLLTARRGSRCRRSPRSMWLWSAGRRLSSRDRSRKNQPGQTG